jgi:hypothetical protein
VLPAQLAGREVERIQVPIERGGIDGAIRNRRSRRETFLCAEGPERLGLRGQIALRSAGELRIAAEHGPAGRHRSSREQQEKQQHRHQKAAS